MTNQTDKRHSAMAETDMNDKVISKRNAGFPEWLDFDKLRQEGIDYLGELSGNIWTDHNAHDPGITILEELCYALLDLGYRTALPAKDLFARDPNAAGEDDNFFTPAVILGCNPLTVTDYRKLLIDVRGVKNAWLVAAGDVSIRSVCHGDNFYKASYNRKDNCVDFLNGLYHVYIDLESQVQRIGQAQTAVGQLQEVDVMQAVRDTLMQHRNLCEDFFDVTVLCRQNVGVCADVMLAAGADADKVFFMLMEALREFLSPSPKFYRLRQLCEKGRSIEEIFEGRPFDLMKSHGFVDVEEFERLQLRKEIHISDLYNVVGSVEGIVSVKNIRLRNSDGSVCPGSTDWVFKLYENHVPAFDPLTSGLNLSGSRGNMVMDTRALSHYFLTNPSLGGKALMTQPSDNLDMLLQPGNFRKDLAVYYPLENDFPKVYGITEGSLADDVSPARKSQALQLRGYLLFFDTLLAGYLAQLRNTRSLFALKQTDESLQHTYFVNKDADRPGLKQLVPYALTDTTPYPTTQAFPVCRRDFETVLTTATIDRCGGEKEFPQHRFCSTAERDVAIQQIIQDLTNGHFKEQIFTNKSGCASFYFMTTSEKFVIVGTEFFREERDARAAAQALMYLCTNEKSFRRYTTADKKGFSFNVVSSATVYWDYLSTLVENRALYAQRRDAFLDHLLARFAETFTDFALLSYQTPDTQSLQHQSILKKENFLSAYPMLSSNRGKAYDYRANGWNNDNVSGVEKRFNAYAGIGPAMQENFCHFEVAEFEEQTVVHIAWKTGDLISSNATFENREAGLQALNNLIKTSSGLGNYEVSHVAMEGLYEIRLRCAGVTFPFALKFETLLAAEKAKMQLHNLFSLKPSQNNIVPSQFEHTLVLEGKEDIWTKKGAVVTGEPVFVVSADALADFGELAEWVPSTARDANPDIKFSSHPDWPQELLDLNAFDPYVNRSDVRKKVTYYKYTVSDRDKSFFFMSEAEFEHELQARESINRLLFLLTDPEHYRITSKSDKEFVMTIVVDKNLTATNTIEFQSDEEGRLAIAPIVEYVQRHSYRLRTDSKPVRWRFNVTIASPGGADYDFVSNAQYTSETEALNKAEALTAPSSNIVASAAAGNQLEIRNKKHPQVVMGRHALAADVVPDEAAAAVNELLNFKKTLVKIQHDPGSPEAQKMVIPDRLSKQGDFGYRLVRKGFYEAWYALDGDFADNAAREKKVSEVYKLYTGSVPYLQLLYGESNLVERRDLATGIAYFHFRVVDVTTGLALFESTRGYLAESLALAAFDARHVSILALAREDASYGTLISFEELLVHDTDECYAPVAEVYVPTETMKRYGYNTTYAQQQLSGLAATFPVQSIQKSDPKFAHLFLCNEPPGPQTDDQCCGACNEKEYYYFAYKHALDNGGGWIGHCVDTPREALQKFSFFLMLLQYRGNFIIHRDECDCRWRLSIREILAESKGRFRNAEAAWGREGVGKFICASQSKNGFSLIRREEDCCFSFLVSCGERGLIHPCIYDTAEKRDEALQRLFRASKSLIEQRKNKTGDDWMATMQSWNSAGANDQYGMRCETLVAWIERFLKGEFQKAFEENKADDVVAMLSTGEKPKLSYEKLKRLARYFPVRRKRLETALEQYQYYLHINLEALEGPGPAADPCGCDGTDQECCTAWISECCFNTCTEALRHYDDVLDCLADKDHYYPTLDCDCKSYGIRFFCECHHHERESSVHEQPSKTIAGRYNPYTIRDGCCNEVLAYNPQCYTTPGAACLAMDRAKRLINAEGIHLVEHILLRPHCREGDCKCIIEPCPDNETCKFVWNIFGDDPCENSKHFCFVPGTDPYSFMVTVALPAWPERFRKKENRQLVEKLIYREMPAHIMTRILWLTPQDLCLFESIYRQWTKWLAHKPVCTDNLPPCRLIRFLFNYPFHCFDCDDCEPCPPGNAVDPCQFFGAANDVPNRFANEINKLYCWNEICPPPVQEKPRPAPLREDRPKEPVIPLIALRDEANDDRQKMDARLDRYRDTIAAIRLSSDNINAEKALTLLNRGTPDFNSYRDVVAGVIANKRSPDNRRLLSNDEKKELVSALTWFYLDQNIMTGRIQESKDAFADMLLKLKGKQLLPRYQEWKANELSKMPGAARVTDIRKLFER
jgi:hypothetical protein